jgi:hypothetical protein
MAGPTRIHDDNPDPAGRGDRRAMRRAPISGDIVPASRRRRAGDDEDDGPSAEDIERFGDVTRTCPECGKDVFDESAVCYHCGHAFMGTAAGSPTRNKLWIVVTVVLLIGVFLWAVMGNII